MSESVAGNFVLVRQVGEGGFGTVYEARDRLEGRTVAMKVLHAIGAHAEGRFEREVSLLAGLAHPSIVRYLGHGRTTDDRPYLAMEWLEGETLQTRLESGALLVDDALLLARRVIGGLEQAQRLGIVHRDLKPANLFLPRGNVAETKILDFGLARRLEDLEGLTGTGVAIGTPHYMSPEQARGERHLTLASDIFALGSVLYSCLTGTQAFDAAHPLAILMMICVEAPPRIESLRPGVPAAFANLVFAMLSKVPADRPTLTVIAREVDALLARPHVDVGAQTEHVVLQARPVSLSLTPSAEQRVLSALFVGHDGASEAALDAALKTLSPAYGARGERLLGGSRILLLDGHVTAGEQALAAARLALALRTVVTVPMVVFTGRAQIERRRPLGELIERGARALTEAQGQDILLDDASAALLAARFDISENGGICTLLGERLGGDAPRTLLGHITPFVGREREVSRLVGLCQEAIEDGTAKVALVVGNAGAGKSRLKYELVQRLQTAAPELRLLSAQGDAMRASAPFSVLTSALNAWAELRTNDTIANNQHKLSTSVLRVVAPGRAELVTSFLGEMVGLPFADESNAVLRAARSDPQVMSDRLLSSFLEWLEAVAVTGPLAMIVEDLHWADAPSVRFLDAALSVLAERPFALVAFARPEVRRSFPTLWAERGVLEVGLPKLSVQACERLLQSLGTTDLKRSTQQWMIERAEGNPFFLEELVRGLRGRAGGREGLPDTILGIIQTRLDALGEGAKALVRAASVFGQVFQVTALKALLGVHAERLDLEGWLRLLIEREVLFARGEAEERAYVFRHALIRDAAYALLTTEEHKLGHRLAAEWLEQHARAEPSVLADHFERGEVPARAAFWYAAAASAAFEADSLPEAVRCGEQALRCGLEGERVGDVAALVSEALSYAGQQVDAIQWAERARAQAALGDAAWWRASQVLAFGTLARGLRDQAAQTIDEMLARVADGSLTAQVLGALSISAGSAIVFQLGDYGSRILTILEGLPAADLPSRVRGFMHAARGAAVAVVSPAQAIAEMREALAQFQSAGSLKDVLRIRGDLGWMLLAAGRLDDAEACLQEGVGLADKFGSRLDVANCRHNLALAYLARGRADLAEQAARGALSVYVSGQELRPAALTLTYLARAVAARGGLDEASELARQARDMRGVDPAARAIALAASAEVALQQGRFDAALAFAHGAMALHQAHELCEDVALIWVAQVEALIGCGHVAEARARLGVALVWLTARADTFEDPAWRAAFLTQVPDNARLMALGERLL